MDYQLEAAPPSTLVALLLPREPAGCGLARGLDAGDHRVAFLDVVAQHRHEIPVAGSQADALGDRFAVRSKHVNRLQAASAATAFGLIPAAESAPPSAALVLVGV